MNYAFLMVEYETPQIIKDIQSKLNKNELYYEEGNEEDYGIETETHVTLVPCLDNKTNLEDIKPLLSDLDEYDIIITDISKFECDNFDVLKASVKNNTLIKTNKKILQKFTSYTEYKYQPHMTIAYMKHGMADKYLNATLSKLPLVKAKNFIWSYHENENDKECKKIKFKS